LGDFLKWRRRGEGGEGEKESKELDYIRSF